MTIRVSDLRVWIRLKRVGAIDFASASIDAGFVGPVTGLGITQIVAPR